ncbi:DUF1266 domain-containing protein [Parablautia muri]|uniref:DUF1266 domain-containing protein n=1 Tax=Parablautia muri TaxID=2320879 RepID=A0A9X5GSK4_9FIRM|nr:DUF1266 domain-containing protein [Parablautia muri]NBJ93279.1 DUF1266 domain-containing protein [Parablautia muri]
MKKLKKKAAVLAIALLLLVTGCGNSKKEIVLKEYTSEDETVSIQMDESWKVEAVNDESGSEGWISAFTEDDSEGIVVMQLTKSVYGAGVDMDRFKEVIESTYPMSEMEDMEAPSVPGMAVDSAYSCDVTAEGVKGAGRVVYGETDYAFYCILYAVPEMDDQKEEYFKNVCGTFKETAPEIENASTVEATDTIQWFNNTCAVLTAVNGWDYTMFGGLPANDASKQIAQALLADWWEVTDRASADETMDWLLTEGHRISFIEDMEYIGESGVGDVPKEERIDYFLDNFYIDEEEAQNYDIWYSCYEQFGDNALAAWDYSRAMSLLGNYYLAGYYTETEALDKSLEVAQIIQEAFGSWDDFMESYFVGYEYWAEESSQERRGIYEDIKAEADSPYHVDWNLTLEKTW